MMAESSAGNAKVKSEKRITASSTQPQRADRALFDAKQGGRDRVEVHPADQGRLSIQQPDSTLPGALV